jgi:hypothetical protein
MEITIDSVKEVAMPILLTGYPVLLRSAHGLGKSSLIYSIARDLGFEKSSIIERRLSQMSEGEMIGLPVVNGDTTKYNPMDWYLKACKEPCFLFFDEIDRASDENRQACFQIMDSRTFNGHKLHEGSFVAAAINGGKSGTNYRVRTMDPAELSRYAVIDIMPDVGSWLSWARQSDIHECVIGFISENRSMLYHNNVFEPNKVYPCPRSWERLSNTIKKNNLIDSTGKISPVMVSIANSFIGDAAPSFYSYLTKTYVRFSLEELLEGKLNDVLDTPNFQARGVPSMIQQIPDCAILSEWKTRAVTDEMIANFNRFIVSVKSNEHFIELLKKLPSVGVAFTRDCTDFTKFYENLFLHNLFSSTIELDSTGKKKKTIKFSEYVTNRLEVMFPDDKSADELNKLLNGDQQ